MEWTNEIIMEFLDLFQSEPEIWNPRHAKHKDRNAIHDAWARIKEQMSVNFPMEEIKNKKNSLMSTYRKLYAKVKAQIRTGSGTEDVFKPDWFAFEKIKTFLHEVYKPRNTFTTEVLENKSSTNEKVPNDINDELQDLSEKTSNEAFVSPISTKKRKMQKTSEIEKRLDEAYNILRDISTKPEQDECSLYVELFGKKLRALNDQNRDIAMFKINILMHELKQQETYTHYSSSSEFLPSPQFHPQPSTSYVSHPSQSQSTYIPHTKLSPGIPSAPHFHSLPSSPLTPQSQSIPSPTYLAQSPQYHTQISSNPTQSTNIQTSSKTAKLPYSQQQPLSRSSPSQLETVSHLSSSTQPQPLSNLSSYTESSNSQSPNMPPTQESEFDTFIS